MLELKNLTNDNLELFEKIFSKGIASVLTPSVFNKGRKDKAGVNKDHWTHAQYSAILDSRTCPYCKYLDGKIISTSSRDYRSGKYSPPQHKHCRCLWVYISKSEDVQANWKVSKKEIERIQDIAHLKSLRNRGY
jgi:SPP1 gp7 family putative phage head morphogenesis protein